MASSEEVQSHLDRLIDEFVKGPPTFAKLLELFSKDTNIVILPASASMLDLEALKSFVDETCSSSGGGDAGQILMNVDCEITKVDCEDDVVVIVKFKNEEDYQRFYDPISKIAFNSGGIFDPRKRK